MLKKWRSIVLFVILIFIVSIFPFNSCKASQEKQKTKIVYFYFNVCPSCEEAEKQLGQLKGFLGANSKDNSVDIEMHKVEYPNNHQLLLKYFDLYSVPQERRKLPILFIGDRYLQGEKDIEDNLQSIAMMPSLPSTLVPEVSDNDTDKVKENFSAMNGAAVFFTGFINGINPCSISMILFFLSLLITKKGDILKPGLAFCAGKFIMYFALGTALYEMLLKVNISLYNIIIKVIIMAVVVIVIIFNMKDYFAAKDEDYKKINMQLPRAFRKFNHKWIEKLSSFDKPIVIILFSILLGMIISIGEFLCTGQMYLTTILYVMQRDKSLNMRALYYFLLYDTAFIIPLVILVIVLNKGKEIFDISEIIRKRLPLIKLITAAAFAILGCMIMFI